MELLEDLSEYYETGEVLSRGDHHRVYAAVERSLEAPCRLHRIDFPESLSDHQRQTVTSLLRRYGSLAHEGVPRLADAWFAESALCAVTYAPEARPIDLQVNNPLGPNSDLPEINVLERTLGMVASLHDAGLVHGSLTLQSFGLGALRKIVLLDMGLDGRLEAALYAEEGDVPILSNNLFAQDLARWAFAMLSLKQGGALLPGGAENEQWDDFNLKKATRLVHGMHKRATLRDFLVECLKGFGPFNGGFESASEARAFWQKNNLRKEEP